MSVHLYPQNLDTLCSSCILLPTNIWQPN